MIRRRLRASLPSPVDVLLGIGMGLLTLPLWFRLVLPASLSYENTPFPVESPVRRGEALAVTAVRCNHSGGPLSYTVTRTLVTVDGPRVVYTLPPSAVFADEPGCVTLSSRLSILPSDLPPGRYEMRGVTTVQEALGSRDIVWRTQPFSVVGG